MTYPVGPLKGKLSGGETLHGSLSLAVIDTPAYEGPYEFTPTQDTQTVLIEGLRATQDITINPIPSNYGRIAWDGSVMTIS